MDVDADTLNLIKEWGAGGDGVAEAVHDGVCGAEGSGRGAPQPYQEAFHRRYAVDSFSEYPFFVDTGTALIDKVNADLYLAF